MASSDGKNGRSSGDFRKGILPVLLILIVVAVIVIASFLYQPPVTDNHNPIFSGISFPEDEGIHSDVAESWTSYIEFKTDTGGHYYMTSNYYYQNLQQFGIKSGRESMLVNLQNSDKISQYLEQNTSITGADGRLALLFTYNNSRSGQYLNDYMFRENGTVDYTYHMEISTRDGHMVMVNLTLHDLLGKPVLATDNGRIYVPGQATFYGYFQPKMSISGEVIIDGKMMNITEGTGVFSHFWGAYSANIVGDEFIIDVPNDYTVIAARYTYAGNGTEAISAMVVVKPDGTYEIVENPVINITAEKYFLAPYDPMERIVWAYQWHFDTPAYGMNMSISGIVVDQIPYYDWKGLCYANGTFESKNYDAVAFADITHHYASDINIENVQLTQNTEIPTEDMRVSCDINHSLPLRNVRLWYNTSVDGNWTSVPMYVKYQQFPNSWEGMIPGQKLRVTVNYYIEVVDVAGHMIRSPIGNHTVEIEYPE